MTSCAAWIASDHERVFTASRKHTIEPIFGQIKHNHHHPIPTARYHRCRSERRLIATTHTPQALGTQTAPPNSPKAHRS